MRNLHRNAEPGPGYESRVGAQKPGRHADAVQARNLRGERGIRSVREDEKTGLRGGFGNRRAGKRVSRRCAGLSAEIGTGRRSVAKTASASALRRFSGRVSMQGVVLSGDWLRERAPLCEEKPPKDAARRFLCPAQAGSWGARRFFSRRLFSAERQDSSGGRRLLQKAAGRRRGAVGGRSRSRGQKAKAWSAVFPDGRGEGQRCPMFSYLIFRTPEHCLFAEQRADDGTGSASLSM